MKPKPICHLPDTHPAYRHYAIHLKPRPGELWAATNRGAVLNSDCGWDEEIRNSDRIGNHRWAARHYFDFSTARKLAEKAAPDVIVNGRTAAELAGGKKAPRDDPKLCWFDPKSTKYDQHPRRRRAGEWQALCRTRDGLWVLNTWDDKDNDKHEYIDDAAAVKWLTWNFHRQAVTRWFN